LKALASERSWSVAKEMDHSLFLFVYLFIKKKSKSLEKIYAIESHWRDV
jgi:hypothetical protein